ncbi:hypothetical protein FQN54_001780 [Arachnomyces sp. PD_36]|nr:hypothetical protein FQN54_001780 [Arachnomyces sp. PD_36]
MSNILKSSVRNVFKEARKTKSAMRRLLNPPDDESFSGSRAYPTREPVKDATFGIRFDLGSRVKGRPGFVTLNLQVNSNAQKKSLRDLVRRHGSHRKYISIEVDTTQPVNEENLDKLQTVVEEKIDELDDL